MIFIDFETRSNCNLKTRGAHNYAKHPSTDVLCLAWLYPEGEPQIWSSPWCGPDPDLWVGEEAELNILYQKVEQNQVFVARNSAFELDIWNHVMVPKYGAPPMKLEQLLDSAAQVAASNVPRSLDGSAKCLKVKFQKMATGRGLIGKLSHGSREDWIDDAEHREAMRGMREYCKGDVLADKATFDAVRQLTTKEWVFFLAHEQINQRGIRVDVPFAEAAIKYAEAEKDEVNEKLQELTADPKMTINASTRKSRFVFDQLEDYPDLQRLVVRPPNPKNGMDRFGFDKVTVAEMKDALTREPYCDSPDPALQVVGDLCAILEEANGAAVKKYQAAVNGADDEGIIRGMYKCNGAGQTGRSSGRGFQPQNLTRDPLIEPAEGWPSKDEAVQLNQTFKDAVIANDDLTIADVLADTELSMTRALGRTCRPTIIAREGYNLVWGDWRSIEWVVNPWLTKTAWGRRRLDFFNTGLDPYRQTAAEMHKVRYDDLDKKDPRRQVGKIAELALGFLGGAGALIGMARKFGMKLSPDEAKAHVKAWREANAGCVDFGNRLLDTVHQAIGTPGIWFPVGRVAYCYDAKMMKGTVLCRLPCGRLIHYPEISVDTVTTETEHGPWTRVQISYRKVKGNNHFRGYMWRGLLLENITQATANSLLREKTVDLQNILVGHTHDELIAECPIDKTEETVERMLATMGDVPAWAGGLPLEVEIDTGVFYYKV